VNPDQFSAYVDQLLDYTSDDDESNVMANNMLIKDPHRDKNTQSMYRIEATNRDDYISNEPGNENLDVDNSAGYKPGMYRIAANNRDGYIDGFISIEPRSKDPDVYNSTEYKAACLASFRAEQGEYPSSRAPRPPPYGPSPHQEQRHTRRAHVVSSGERDNYDPEDEPSDHDDSDGPPSENDPSDPGDPEYDDQHLEDETCLSEDSDNDPDEQARREYEHQKAEDDYWKHYVYACDQDQDYRDLFPTEDDQDDPGWGYVTPTKEESLLAEEVQRIVDTPAPYNPEYENTTPHQTAGGQNFW
jgi:hypothetical protein